jgi:glycosyltransferase involved in cell wall biosynthesis
MTEADKESTLAIVIPAYNEAEGIGATLDDLVARGIPKRAEVIVVDDGSTDNTSDVVKKYPVTLLRHPVNKGYGASLKTGIRHAKADRIITMDSDGQHSAEDVEAIRQRLADGAMVIGERTADSFQVQNRKLGKWIIRVVGEYLVEQKLPDFNSGLRGFDRRLMRSVLHMMPNGFSFSTTSTLAFLKGGYVIATVPITAKPRVGRVSSVRSVRDGIKTLVLLTRIIMLFNPLKIFLPASLGMGIWGVTLAIVNILGDKARVSNGAVIVMVTALFLFFFGLLADQISMLNLRERDDGGN